MFGMSGSSATAERAPSSPSPSAAPGSGHQEPAIDLGSLLPDGWEHSNSAVARAASTLLSNPYFSAGAGLWLLTVGGMMGRQSMLVAQTLLRRKFVVSMEITNQDSAFQMMLRWLDTQPHFRVQQTSVTSIMQQTARSSSSDRDERQFIFGPSPNTRHFFFHEGRPITLQRRRRENTGGGYEAEVFETLEFTSIGLDSSMMQRMMKAAYQHAKSEDSDRTVVYLNAGSSWVRQQRPQGRRPLESVILPGEVSHEIIDDVKRFLGSESYYRGLGVPYRRGYLLHGPPGCGKTSYVMAVAGELRLSISLLSLSNRNLNDETLMSLLNNAHMDTIVLMEDIDRAFSNDCNVTMSGLLNALDGVGAQEGRLVFMTTNHVEMLDPALIRPGRADVKVEIGLLGVDQVRRMFQKFYPSAAKELEDAFVAQLPANKLSAAQLQSHLFFYRDNPEGAVKTVRDFMNASMTFDETMQKRREMKKKMADLPRAPLLGLD